MNYCNTLSVDDMTVKPGHEGATAERVSFCWHWDPEANGGPIGGESCIIILFTAEDVSLDCIAPATGGAFSGIVYNFGVLGDGYYLTSTGSSLCDAGLYHEMPADGQGGTMLMYMTGDGFVCATCAQPMLWGTMDPGHNPPGTAPFSQIGIKWDDDNPRDGVLTENECYDYTGTVPCPDPLGNAITFGAGTGEPCAPFVCGDCNCDGVFNGADIDPFFLALVDPVAWQAQYPICDWICAADINKDGAVNGADIDPFFVGLGLGRCP